MNVEVGRFFNTHLPPRGKTQLHDYVHFFGLKENPFTVTPDTRYFFAHNSCQDALNVLLLATYGGEGFIKITGEVGTGKTLLCRKFLSSLDEDYLTAYIPNPYLEPATLLFAIADELGVAYSDHCNQHQILKLMTQFLIETYAQQHCAVVICLDEAHVMPIETLEMLRLLGNLETQRRKLLQIVLFGQPELDRRLDLPAVRQLKQRIGFSCQLAPLKRIEVEDYLHHRLSIAGLSGPRLFSKTAVKLLYNATHGIPRLVNIVCFKALLAAYGQGQRLISARHITAAIKDTESVQHKSPAWKKYLGLGLTAGFLTGLLSIGWLM